VSKAGMTKTSSVLALKHRMLKPLFEYEGKYDEDPKLMFNDENVNLAIELRNSKQKHTDFFFKLHDLKERI
jgi:hypothetical protein